MQETRAALPLGQLGNCLRPPNGWGPHNFRKERVEGEKNLVSDESKKNPARPFNQKTKFLLYPVKHW